MQPYQIHAQSPEEHPDYRFERGRGVPLSPDPVDLHARTRVLTSTRADCSQEVAPLGSPTTQPCT
eukprot:1076874-Lingulodinium_polyedra.AAC.1